MGIRNPLPCLIIVAVLFLCGAGCSDDAVQLSRLPPDAVILAFGDSLTEGTGTHRNYSYPSVLEQLSGRKVINAGHAGEISEEGLRRLPGLLDKHHPSMLILCHGGNDILRKKDLAKMEANVRAMIQTARERNIPVVLLGVPQPGLFLSSAEHYQRIAESTDVIFIEDLIPDVLGNNNLKSDTVHPNQNGYRVMAENIYSVLREAGAL